MITTILCNSYFNKYSITFSNPKTQSLVGILELHDHLMFFILLIFNIKMCFFLYSIITSRKKLFFNKKKKTAFYSGELFDFQEQYVLEEVYSFKHATVLEFIWTILPGVVLVIMAIPSFMLLYSLEESNFPVFNICVIGNQWYWSYEYMDFDVLHYYNKFLNNKIASLRENIQQYKILLDYIFIESDNYNILKALDFTLVENKPNTFLDSTFVGEYIKKSKNALFFNDLDWSWLSGSFDKKFSENFAHSFYVGKLLDFDILKELIVEDFYLNNLFLDFDIEPILTPSDSFLTALEDKFEDTLTLDCQIVSEQDLPVGYPRLLTTDQVLVIPSETPLRFLVTSNDVIHSWCVPSFGIKMDAIPGRLNQVLLTTPYYGTSWGQCSELCGVNHGFMPIEIRAIPYEDFSPYIKLLIKSYVNSFTSNHFSLNLLFNK
jgi:heme/copper-type cytochrome/quinol oxidase subunit 2